MDSEARRHACAVSGNGRQAMVQRTRTIFGVKVRQQVHDAGQYGQPLAPTRLPVTGAEVQADTERFNRIDTLIQQADDGLSDNAGIFCSSPSLKRWR